MTTTTWSCVWQYGYSLQLFRLLVVATTKAMANQSQSSKLCAGIYLLDVLCAECMSVHWSESAWCNGAYWIRWWSVVKMCELQSLQSWFIMWYKMPCVTFNRTMFFLQMQNHFQSNTRTHTQMPSTTTTANSFSAANFPATHGVIHHCMHVSNIDKHNVQYFVFQFKCLKMLIFMFRA